MVISNLILMFIASMMVTYYIDIIRGGDYQHTENVTMSSLGTIGVFLILL